MPPFPISQAQKGAEAVGARAVAVEGKVVQLEGQLAAQAAELEQVCTASCYCLGGWRGLLGWFWCLFSTL